MFRHPKVQNINKSTGSPGIFCKNPEKKVKPVN
jgi:hypothetical protein